MEGFHRASHKIIMNDGMSSATPSPELVIMTDPPRISKKATYILQMYMHVLCMHECTYSYTCRLKCNDHALAIH